MTAFKKPLCGIMAFIMAFTMVIAAAPVSVFAADEEATYSAGEIELNKKTEGDYEYIKVEENSAIQLIKYIGSDAEVTIPSKVAGLKVISVGSGCFAGNTTITSVKFNNSITDIGDEAFKGCTALKEVKKMDAVTTIGVGVFEDCSAMTEFTYPDTITFVPERMFKGCTALADIKDHKNLKDVAADAFEGTAFENNQPDGALNFGRVVYSNKGNVADIVIAEDISIIEDYAFLGNESIKTLEFGFDVEEIGLYAFQNCVNLEKVTFNEAIGIVSAGAFKGCEKLEAVDFAETTLATIGYEAFSGCKALGEVILPETVSDIGDFAFKDTCFKKISFQKNVSSVGAQAFAGNTVLEAFEVVDKNKTYSAVDGVLFNKDGDAIIIMPAGKKGDYTITKNVEEIGAYAFNGSAIQNLVIEGADADNEDEQSSLRFIGEYAFENSSIEKITIPARVEKIGVCAFKDSALKEVTFKEGLKYISARAFENCVGLTNVVFPDSLYEIANNAFLNAGLVSVEIGNGLAKIADSAFAGNTKLQTIKFGTGIKKISDNAFKGCVALTAVALPKTLQSFSGSTFSGCDSLKAITVEEGGNYKTVGSAIYTADGKNLVIAGNSTTTGVILADGTEVINANAFDTAKNVTTVSVPATLKEIKGNALDVTAWFNNSTGVLYVGKVLYRVKADAAALIIAPGTTAIADNAINVSTLSSVVIPNTVERIGKYAFKNSALTTLTIPSSVTYIGDGAFENIATLTTVNLSENLEVLSSAAFKGCSALKEISVPANVKNLAADTFAGCTALEKVTLSAVEEIEEYAFSDCTALKEIALPATLAELSPIAFDGCSALESITVDEANSKYKSFDMYIFVANEELGEDGNPVFETIALCAPGTKDGIMIPSDIKYIADRAFYNCDGITSVGFHDSFENIGNEAFFDCDNIQSVTMPESARDIGDHAFASCDNLREFIVNSNLTDYADNAFDGCYYFGYDNVTINVADSSYGLLIVIAAIFIVIGVVWYLVYNKKQKKIEKELQEKLAKKAALEAQTK